MKKKFLSGLPFLKSKNAVFMMFIALGIGIAYTSKAAETLHVCPGNGEVCKAEITFGGQTVSVNSYKTKGSGSITVVKA